MLRKLLLLTAPLLLVLACEIAFRAGAWEPFALPSSHAGTSIRLKRALLDPANARIDFVTLGSSRPENGLDHAAIAAAAKAHGYVHANLSMPGTHWMTLGVLEHWLAGHHPEVRGGVIALSVADFSFVGNGSYELGIVAPFRSWEDQAQLQVHVPFERADLATWGTRSLLAGYREDLGNLVAHPQVRIHELTWFRKYASELPLYEKIDHASDICALDLSTPETCAATAAALGAEADTVRRQCPTVATPATRADYRIPADQPLPPHMAILQDRVRQILTGLHWQSPPVVLLMPTHSVWLDRITAAGMHDWVRSVLRPLEQEGRIRVIDQTDLFRDGGDSGEMRECAAYWDIYHQNTVSQRRLTELLLPELERQLYTAGPTVPTTAAP